MRTQSADAKRMVRQMLFGLPGPQKTAVQWSQLITSLAAAASMLNNMPYLDESNRLLLAPRDFLTPWKHGSPLVQEIPVTKLKSLEEARRMLTARQVHMRKIKEVEMATELSRFKNSFLKLGKNQKIESLTAGPFEPKRSQWT